MHVLYRLYRLIPIIGDTERKRLVKHYLWLGLISIHWLYKLLLHLTVDSCPFATGTPSKNTWFEPLDSLIADRLELLEFGSPSPYKVGKQEASQELQIENHAAYLGKYLLMAQEYLTSEEQEELYRMNALEFSDRIRYIYRYFVFVAREINKELP